MVPYQLQLQLPPWPPLLLEELEEELLELDELLLDDELLLEASHSVSSMLAPQLISQVWRPMQLWPFSHPQPVFWFAQSGNGLPYQLHISQVLPCSSSQMVTLELPLL